MLIKNVEVDGRVLDLRLTTTIVEMGEGLLPGDDAVIDGLGCAALPGLHDHHIHLNAAAAWASSVSCDGLGPDRALDLHVLLQEASGTDWIRGVAYHESMAGNLDRIALDALCNERPVRLQHASGKLWILNSAAIDRLALEQVDDQAGLERDAKGKVSGRLFRMDDWLRQRLQQPTLPNLGALSLELASYGITGVTDASYSNSARTAEHFSKAQTDGELLQTLRLMGDESLVTGNLKILLDEDNLPNLDDLVARVRRTHEAGRGIAFHCVSHIELLFALTVLDETGTTASDRIEHAAVVRDDVLERLVHSGCTVVTQPGFILQRGERLRRQTDAADLPYLYRYASLIAAGVPVAASSDAPYGPKNPWAIVAAAATRRTENGQILGGPERVSTSEALRGFLSKPEQPGGVARKLEVGVLADVCVLGCRLAAALSAPATVAVQHTIAHGVSIYTRVPSTSSVCSPK